MFCKKCGTENAEDVAFCKSCGAKISETDIKKTEPIKSEVIRQFQARARAGWTNITVDNGILSLKRSRQEKNIPLNMITSVSVFKATYDLPFVEKSVQIFSQGSKHTIKRLAKAKANELKKIILEHQNNQGQGNVDSISQLEKLAALKEKGVINQEEFEAKKKQLLDAP